MPPSELEARLRGLVWHQSLQSSPESSLITHRGPRRNLRKKTRLGWKLSFLTSTCGNIKNIASLRRAISYLIENHLAFKTNHNIFFSTVSLISSVFRSWTLASSSSTVQTFLSPHPDSQSTASCRIFDRQRHWTDRRFFDSSFVMVLVPNTWKATRALNLRPDSDRPIRSPLLS